ncbi:hypothetical protein KLMIMMO078B4_19350 [Klebsiella michiganensis]
MNCDQCVILHTEYTMNYKVKIKSLISIDFKSYANV